VPTLEEAMRMAERSKTMGEVARMKPKEDAPAEQLGLFDGEPVHAFKASLAAAGYITIDDKLKKNQRVKITAEGYVRKVANFDEKNGVSVLQFVVVVDPAMTTIEPFNSR
jgi:hypothetical protein